MSKEVAAGPQVLDLEEQARPLVEQAIHQLLRQQADEKCGAGKWKERGFTFHGFYTDMRKGPGLTFQVDQPEYEIPDIEKLPGTDELFWSTNDVNNYSPTETIVAHPAIKNSRSRTFTWGLTQSLKIGAKAKICIPLAGETELTTEVALGGHETWQSVAQQSVDFVADVPCPPRTCTSIRYIQSLKDVTVEWQVPVSLTCKAWAELEAQGPKEILHIDGCYDIDFMLSPEQNRFLVKGRTTGAMGFDGRLDAKPHPLPDTVAAGMAGGLTGESLTTIFRTEPAG